MSANNATRLHVFTTWCRKCMKHYRECECQRLEHRLNEQYRRDPYLEKRPEYYLALCLEQLLEHHRKRLQPLAGRAYRDHDPLNRGKNHDAE